MDLVDEEHVVRLQVREEARKVGGLVQHRPAGDAEPHSHFLRDDVRQRGLSQAGRAMQQHVVQGLTALPGGLHEHLQVIGDRLLPRELRELARTQHLLQLLVGGGSLFFAGIERLGHGGGQK